MSNRRRIIIIVISVTLGSLFALLVIKKRVGALSHENYIQLVFNFIFAVAIVVGIGLLFRKMNKDEK
jgi:hypothetical protein